MTQPSEHHDTIQLRDPPSVEDVQRQQLADDLGYLFARHWLDSRSSAICRPAKPEAVARAEVAGSNSDGQWCDCSTAVRGPQPVASRRLSATTMIWPWASYLPRCSDCA